MKWWRKIDEKRHLRSKVREYESAIDALNRQLALEQARRSLSTPLDRATVTREIIERYEGRAVYGNVLVKRIVGLLAAYQLGSGVELVVTPPRETGMEPESKVDKQARGKITDRAGLDQMRAEAQDLETQYAEELAFVRDFMDANNLSEERSQELAREKEFSGQLLLRLYWSEADRMVKIRFAAWDETRYTVTRDKLGNLLSAQWFDEKGQEVKLAPEEFVFARWNGRLNGVTGSPTLAGQVWLCDNIEKAIKDLRQGNHFFGYPTLFMETVDKQQADDINAAISQLNWQVGQSLAASAKASFLEITGQAAQALIDEIKTEIQLLSGGTGVNPHFLGWPDLMSNRATADDMENPVVTVAVSDVQVWIGMFEELFAKATAMYNRNMRLPRALIPGAVKAMIITSTQVEFKRIKDVWMPLRVAGEIDQDTFLSKIPGIKADRVKAALEAERAQAQSQPAAKDPNEINQAVERMRHSREGQTNGD